MNSIYSIFATEDGAERLLSPLAEETQALWKMSSHMELFENSIR